MTAGAGPVGVGILGAGRIAGVGVGPAIVASALATVAAVGARDPRRARRLASQLGAPAAGTYRDVLDDPAVEVVYVALPNDAHLPWTLAALAAGKHVLVEKPAGLDAAEVAEAFDAAEAAGRVLVEASWYRWHPRTRAAEAHLRAGAIGPVSHVDAGFTFGGVPGGDYRMDPAHGGGALYDVGCYAISAAVWATGGSALRADTVEVRRSPGGVDLATTAHLVAPGGAEVHVTAGIDHPERQWLELRGTAATMTFADPAFTAWRRDAVALRTGDVDQRWDPVDPYRLMVDAVAGRVRGGGDWVVPRSDSEAVARTIDAVRAASG